MNKAPAWDDPSMVSVQGFFVIRTHMDDPLERTVGSPCLDVTYDIGT
jgi:hypothetical protein